jgi:hypothetical protein
VSQDLQTLLGEYRRIHYYPNPQNIEEAALFLTSSLLLSHGIRRDTVSIICFRNKTIVLPGDRARHLRPDMESAKGWIKAVLFKRRNLGATVYRECINIQGLTMEKGLLTLVTKPENSRAASIPDLNTIKLQYPLTLYYTCKEPAIHYDLHFKIPCSPPCRAAILNIILDRIEAGLPPL